MKQASVQIVPPDVTTINFIIEGMTPYLANRMDVEAIRAWRDEKENKKVRKPKKKLSPQQTADKGVYWAKNGKDDVPCIPGAAFKRAMIEAARFIDGLAMTQTRGPFQIAESSIPITFDEMNLREDIVREPPGPRGVPNIRHRWEFVGWACEVPVRFDANVISIEQLANLLSMAGFHLGVGDWRPQKGGDFGTFQVLGGK